VINVLNPVGLGALAALVVAASCVPATEMPEPKDPKDVQLLKTAPPSACKELGNLTGEAANGEGAERLAKANLREKAARMGANYVRWETIEISEEPARTTINGVAYFCPPAAASSPAPPA
jgi:hypothetical protein